MKDLRHREMMAELYRLYERYEAPKEGEAYWRALIEECNTLCAKYREPVLTGLCNGLVDGLERAAVRHEEVK